MNARLTLGVAIPQTFPDGRIEPRRIQSFVQRAEALGFHSAWVVEHTFGLIFSITHRISESDRRMRVERITRREDVMGH